MKSLREELWFEVPNRRGFINITATIEALVRKSGVREGLLLHPNNHISYSELNKQRFGVECYNICSFQLMVFSFW